MTKTRKTLKSSKSPGKRRLDMQPATRATNSSTTRKRNTAQQTRARELLIQSLEADSTSSYENSRSRGSRGSPASKSIEVSDDDDDDDGDDAVPPPSVSIGGRRGNPSSPLSSAGRSVEDDIGDVGVNIFAPPILPNKPKLATLKDLKDVVPHPKGTRGKKPTTGDYSRQLNEANKRIEEMAGFVTSVSNSMRDYTKSVKVVVDTSHKQLVKTHASLMKTVETNVKTVGDLSNKLDTAERKMVSTKDHLTFELQKAEAMAELGLASSARTIKELENARTHYKKERDDAVTKLTKVRILFLLFILLFL